MNQVLRFVDEACIREEDARVRSRELFHGYRAWAEGGGERPMTERSFSQRIVVELGFKKGHDERGSYYSSVCLRAVQEVLVKSW